MPIYEYACPECGHQNDHLQKLADAPIAACPKCGSAKYYKKISAAGFALKGTGWYVTDFRNGNTGQKPADKKDGDAASPAANPATAPASSDGAASPAATSAPTPASTPAPAAAPAAAPAPTASSASK